MQALILGTWESDPDDTEALERFGRVTLRFAEDGTLEYTIHLEGRDQRMFLTYEVSQGVITTNQASKPRREETPYRITPDGRLVLSYGRFDASYVREKGSCSGVS